MCANGMIAEPPLVRGAVLDGPSIGGARRVDAAIMSVLERGQHAPERLECLLARGCPSHPAFSRLTLHERHDEVLRRNHLLVDQQVHDRDVGHCHLHVADMDRSVRCNVVPP
jgi:hypothetical protein